MKVIITGATKGIGRALSLRFAQEGFDLCICSRTIQDLENLKAELLQINSKANILIQAVDMSKKGEVKAFADFILNNWTSVDVLINNAGVFLPCSLKAEDTEEAFEMMMNTNLYSTYYMTRGVLPLMTEAKRGHIFNICSIASFMPYGAYSVSKHAMLGFSKVLREEVKEDGIRVTAVMPGATYTASWEGVDLPEERFMKAEDIADSIWGCYQLSKHTVVEEIILRPQLGDI